MLPAQAVTNLSGFANAMQQVFTVYGGSIAKDGTATLSGAGTVLGATCAIMFILIAAIQLIVPGLGDQWFGSNYAPSGWAYSQRGTYLLTELIPVLTFAAIGALFWFLGRNVRKQVIPAVPQPAQAAEA